MEEGQITLQDWLNWLISRRNALESKFNYYLGGTLSLFIFTMTLQGWIYFESGKLFPIGFSEENLLAFPIGVIMIILLYAFILESYRLDAFNTLIKEIFIENKTDLDYIKKRYLLIEEMCESVNLELHIKKSELLNEN